MATDTVPVIALRAPKTVPLNQVDRELSRIWATQGEDRLATRASTFNFLVYAAGNTVGLEDAIGAVAVQYPCRTVVIIDDPSIPSDGVQAEVTAYCPLVQGGQPATVCCEYVTLRSTGETLRELYTTVLPLLIPELPTYLWWQGDFQVNDHLFVGLRSLAERLMVDSGTTGSWANLVTLAQLEGETKPIGMGDLNWWRLLPWREITAKAFDNPQRLASLSQVLSLELEYTAAEGNAAQPLLYLLWLAQSLGWQPKTWTTAGMTFWTGDNTLDVVWKATPGKQPGALTLVKMNLPDQKYLMIRSGVIADCVELQLEENGQCTFEQVTGLRDLALRELLTEELQTSSTTDPLYSASLGLFRSFLAL
jgi:glucose-6-phosphate dehydrogenase assembly protein OpcA